MSGCVSKWVRESVCKLASKSVSQSVLQSVKHTVSKQMSQSVSKLDDDSILDDDFRLHYTTLQLFILKQNSFNKHMTKNFTVRKRS